MADPIRTPFVYQSGLTVEQIESAAQAVVISNGALAAAARSEGIADLKAINGKVCLYFSKAYCVEQKFGKTTDEALYWLNQAIAAIPA